MIWFSKQPTELLQQTLQQQIKWKYPERPVLKSWAIEARDYDTVPLNYCYAIGVIFLMALVIFLYWLLLYKNAPFIYYIFLILMLSLMFGGFYWLIHSVTLSKKFLVYRFTRKGFEIASWNRQAEGQQKIFIGVAVVCSLVAFIIVALVPQAFFLLFIGPGGIVLLMLSQTTNKQAWEQQKDYSQKDFDWDLFAEILLYKQRHILTLFFDAEERNKRLGRRSIMEKIHIFCYSANYQEMIEFVQNKVKENTPCREGYVEIFPDECC